MDEKKYPWTKSIFKKKKPKIECVYAGPPHEPKMRAVYAGPQMMGKYLIDDPEEPEETAPRTEKVYAGPADPGKRTSIPKSEAEMEDVYAGPGYFGEPDEPEDEIEEEPAEAPEASAEAAEASDEIPPEAFAPPKDPPIMVTYAGPRLGGGNGGAFAFPQGVPIDTSRKLPGWCSVCGNPLPENAKFCPECGKPVEVRV